MAHFTEISNQYRPGNQSALDTLFAEVYPEIKRIAACHMRTERPCHSLQVTALVHETYLRLAGSRNIVGWRDRAHFLALASSAMRRILVDQARARLSQKRTQCDWPTGISHPGVFLDLHEALNDLARIDARQAQIVEMRFFGGYTEEEIGAALGLSARTVKRDWVLAKAWLFGESKEAQGNE